MSARVPCETVFHMELSCCLMVASKLREKACESASSEESSLLPRCTVRSMPSSTLTSASCMAAMGPESSHSISCTCASPAACTRHRTGGLKTNPAAPCAASAIACHVLPVARSHAADRGSRSMDVVQAQFIRGNGGGGDRCVAAAHVDSDHVVLDLTAEAWPQEHLAHVQRAQRAL